MTPEELADALADQILGSARLTSDQVVAGSDGGTLDEATELWLSLGFPPVDPGDAAFTEADAEALASVMALRQLGYDSTEVVIPMTRVLGQALARVATAQAQAFHDGLLAAIDPDDGAAAGSDDLAGPTVDAIAELLVPRFESFVSYVWRRHLVAAIRRDLLGATETLTVGFADLVGFTRETRGLADAELSELLTRFQRIATEQVTASGARIVKLLGDGVMFATSVPEQAARAALGLVEACEADEVVPSVRVGLARGHVVELEGDLFGETVNRSSRLADAAFPGSVLADPDAAEALDAVDALWVKRTPPHKLKGLGRVATSRVRWAGPDRG